MGSQDAAPRLHWWGTVLYVPVLYGLGWLASRPLLLLAPSWRTDQVDLAGLAVSLLLLLVTLPLRLRRVWGVEHPWQHLGVAAMGYSSLVRALLRGLLKALLLLLPLTLLLLSSGQARWLGELELLLGRRRALVAQAGIFALLHPWYRLPGLQAVALLGGLTLLGLALALQRRADGGVLWGAIGLHGGLVGGWFALQNGLFELSPASPAWLVGPGGANPNPIGGLFGLLGLLALLWVRRRWWQT